MEKSESLAEYRERWHDLLPLPATFAWADPLSESALLAIAESLSECTCDVMLLMRAGCRCGKVSHHEAS